MSFLGSVNIFHGRVEAGRALLAHEIGHHVRYPQTLGLAAALELLEHRLIPGLKSARSLGG